jgi:hypothetical protein
LKRAVLHRLIFRDFFDPSQFISKESYTGPSSAIGQKRTLAKHRSPSLVFANSKSPLNGGV